MLIFMLFSAGCWLSVWGMHLYSKSRNRYDNRFEKLMEDAPKDKLTKKELPAIKKTLTIGIIASVLLLTAMLLKYNHFSQYAQKDYTGEYIWIAPCLLIFNSANIIASIITIISINKTKNS